MTRASTMARPDGVDRRELRAAAEAAIERLVSLLDDLDGDPDLEEEPDLEETCEDEGAQCDDEGAIESDTGADDMGEQGYVVPHIDDQSGEKWLGRAPVVEKAPAPDVPKVVYADAGGRAFLEIDGVRWNGGRVSLV